MDDEMQIADERPIARLSLESRPESLTRTVYETIRAAIVDRSLPPGTHVTEAKLAAQLNVSKTPVREALQELRQAGLIEDWGRRGGRVISPSREMILHIAQTREANDVFLARAAAENATKEAREQIALTAARSHDAAIKADSDEFDRWNLAFHLALAEAVGNPFLIRSVRDMLTLGAAVRLRDFPRGSPIVALAEDHIRIADAIARGNPDVAGLEASAHIKRSVTYNLAAFSEFNGSATAA